jgi:putative transposase
VGKIDGHWLPSEQKTEILLMIDNAKEQGIAISRACAMWGIQRRRTTRWRSRWASKERLDNGKPGPTEPCHTLLPQERTAVLEMAREDAYADCSHRILAVTAWDLGRFFVSFSSVYRILRAADLMSLRGKHRHHNGRSLAPVRRELTGPNQRWCWDISYLHTFEKGLFLFLYVLLDEFSRKVIQWRVRWHQSAQEAHQLLDGGLIAESILDLPEDRRPEIVNDRGRQMKARSIRVMFEDHKMPQLFARPRTPNDNPFVESLFGTAKTTPEYPGRFLDLDEAVRYFEHYFRWYNTEHLHSGIDYVTPEQCHQGLRNYIVSVRQTKLTEQRRKRKEVNRLKILGSDNSESLVFNPNDSLTCSVINS